MEIIHLSWGKANPERMNGVNKVVYNLASSQAEAGHQVSYWGITHTPDATYPERNFNTLLFKPSRWRIALPEGFIQAVLSLKSDVVFHLHGGFILDFYPITRLLEKRGMPFVFTPHGSYNVIAMKKNYWIKRSYFSLVERRVLTRARYIHLLGESELDGLRKRMIPERVALIPNGFNPGEVLPVLGKNIEQNRHPVFGFVGRIDIYTKGLDLLLKGFATFVQLEQSKAKLKIIGDGKELPKLKQMAHELGIEKQVEFTGSKFGDEKLELMRTMDFFYHPSRNEGIPTAVLEAAALGIPCIVSKETNMAGYISSHKAGIALHKNSSSTIAASMKSALLLWMTNLHEEIGKNGQQMIDKTLSWERIAEKLVTTYQAS